MNTPPRETGPAAAPTVGTLGSDATRFGRPAGGWRLRWHVIIFESDTPAGKAFDVALIWAILASVLVVMLDSVADLHARYATGFLVAEWAFTLFFTAEYLARLATVQHPWRYATSFYGVVDLLAVAPTYLAVLVPELHALIDVRILRLLRVIRIFKLAHYALELRFLAGALRASSRKIAVFLAVVLMLVVVLGTVMYVVEGPANGYTSIPISVYWAITTLTTVGFGDITPKTDLGRFIASLMMLLGWGILAVPTGIVTAEMTAARRPPGGAAPPSRTCPGCGEAEHAGDARHCRLCGERLPPG